MEIGVFLRLLLLYFDISYCVKFYARSNNINLWRVYIQHMICILLQCCVTYSPGTLHYLYNNSHCLSVCVAFFTKMVGRETLPTWWAGVFWSQLVQVQIFRSTVLKSPIEPKTLKKWTAQQRIIARNKYMRCPVVVVTQFISNILVRKTFDNIEWKNATVEWIFGSFPINWSWYCVYTMINHGSCVFTTHQVLFTLCWHSTYVF